MLAPEALLTMLERDPPRARVLAVGGEDAVPAESAAGPSRRAVGLELSSTESMRARAAESVCERSRRRSESESDEPCEIESRSPCSRSCRSSSTTSYGARFNTAAGAEPSLVTRAPPRNCGGACGDSLGTRCLGPPPSEPSAWRSCESVRDRTISSSGSGALYASALLRGPSGEGDAAGSACVSASKASSGELGTSSMPLASCIKSVLPEPRRKPARKLVSDTFLPTVPRLLSLPGTLIADAPGELGVSMLVLPASDENGDVASRSGEPRPSIDGEPAGEAPGELGTAELVDAESLRRIALSTTPLRIVLASPAAGMALDAVASSLARRRCAMRAAMTALTDSADGNTAPKMPPSGVPVPLGVGLSGVALYVGLVASMLERAGLRPLSVSTLSTGADLSSCSLNVMSGAAGSTLRTGDAA